MLSIGVLNLFLNVVCFFLCLILQLSSCFKLFLKPSAHTSQCLLSNKTITMFSLTLPNVCGICLLLKLRTIMVLPPPPPTPTCPGLAVSIVWCDYAFLKIYLCNKVCFFCCCFCLILAFSLSFFLPSLRLSCPGFLSWLALV